MAKMVDPIMDSLGDNDESVYLPREPMQTPGSDQIHFSTEMEEEVYDENKKLHTVLK